jgi:hypothetical protein
VRILWFPALSILGILAVTEIIDACYVLVGNPLLTHLEKGFNGLKPLRDVFLDHSGAASDFESLGDPVVFPGFTVSIYRRVGESDEWKAFAAIKDLESAVP